MNDATAQSRFPVVLGVLVLLALGGGPACDFVDGTPILTSDDGAADDDAGEDDVASPEDAATDHGPDADADGDVEAVAEADAEADDDGGPDDAGPACEAVLSEPLNIFPAAADGDERPIALRSGSGFVALARLSGPVSADGLRFQRVNLDGSPATAAMWSISSVEIGAMHSALEMPDGTFGLAFVIPEGAEPGIWIKTTPSSGTGGMVPRLVPETDANDGEPTLAFDGTDLVVAWTRTDAGAVDVKVRRIDAATGEALGPSVVVATGPAGTREPRLVWGSTRFALAYFNAADGELHVLSLDGTLDPVADFPLPAPAGHDLIGYPSLVWNGWQFGLAWETRGTTSAQLHLATFGPDETPLEHPILPEVPLGGTEQGQVALAWGESTAEWGLAWRHTETSRIGITLARIDGIDFRTLGSPVDLRPESTIVSHPSLAYNAGHYMVLWTEPSGSAFPVYEATYGCLP